MFNLRTNSLIIALAAVMSLSAVPANAAGYIKFDGVEGESTEQASADVNRRRGATVLEDMRAEQKPGTPDQIENPTPDPQASLLLPAIQKVREAAAKEGKVETTWKVEKGEK